MKLFLFECKKLWKKRTTWFTLIVSVVAIMCLYILSYSMGEQLRQENAKEIRKWMENYPKNMQEEEAKIKEAEEKGNQLLLETLMANKEHRERDYKYYQQSSKSYEERDWQSFNEAMLAKSISKNIVEEPAYSFAVYDHQLSFFTARATLGELQWLAKNDVEPFAQRDVQTDPFLSTIYDDFKGRELKEWEKLSARYATTGFLFVYQLVQYVAIPVCILIGCFLFGNNVSSEIGKKKRGLFLAYVLPVKRVNVFFAKYISGLLATWLFVMCLLAVPILGSLFIGGIGSLEYPVLVYEGSSPSVIDPEFNSLKPREDQFHFVPLKEYFGQAFLLTSTLTVMLYSLYYVLALVCKLPTVTVMVTAVITFIGMKMAPLPYNPFLYVDMNKIINGEAATIAFHSAIHLQTGFVTVSVFGCALCTLGYIVFKKIKL